MEKPISMIIEETKQELISVINKCQLHPSLTEMILKDIYTEISMLSMNIRNQEKEKYLQEQESTER